MCSYKWGPGGFSAERKWRPFLRPMDEIYGDLPVFREGWGGKELSFHGNAAALRVLDFYLQSARDRNMSQGQ